MKEEVDRGLADSRPGVHLKFWAHDEFLPIAEALDKLAENLGWLKRE